VTPFHVTPKAIASASASIPTKASLRPFLAATTEANRPDPNKRHDRTLSAPLAARPESLCAVNDRADLSSGFGGMVTKMSRSGLLFALVDLSLAQSPDLIVMWASDSLRLNSCGNRDKVDD
jgi:hypothetical protein